MSFMWQRVLISEAGRLVRIFSNNLFVWQSRDGFLRNFHELVGNNFPRAVEAKAVDHCLGMGLAQRWEWRGTAAGIRDVGKDIPDQSSHARERSFHTSMVNVLELLLNLVENFNFRQRYLRFVATGSIMLFIVCIVLGAVLATIVYRVSLMTVIYGGFGYFLRGHAQLFTSMTAASFNLVIIMLLTKVKLEKNLTSMMIRISPTGLSPNRNLFNQHWKSPHTNWIRRLVHAENLRVWVHELLLVADLHCVLQRPLLQLSGRRWSEEKPIFEAQRRHLRSCWLPQRTLHPTFHHNDRQADREQFYRIFVSVSFTLNVANYFNSWFNSFRKFAHKLVATSKAQEGYKRQISFAYGNKQLIRIISWVLKLCDLQSWEQDYQLQDPGRLALFDEYLEMSKIYIN